MSSTSRKGVEDTDRDYISVSEISIPRSVLAPDVWGRTTAQPALVSLELSLRSKFTSAADSDRLDDSTVHYGTLTKKIRAICENEMTFEEVLSGAFEVVEALGRNVLAACEVKVRLPEGAMLGDAISLTERRTYAASIAKERTFEFRGVRLPVKVGVNAYERLRKQPLVFDLKVHFRDENIWHDLFDLERSLVQVVEDTAYETLESLIDFAVKELRDSTLDELIPGGRIELQIVKPRAMKFADPSVRVSRSIPPR